MTESAVLALGQQAVTVMLMVAGPMLVASLIVGLVISIFQAVTQINEMTLTFIPKMLAMLATGALAGGWMLNTMVNYTQGLLLHLPDFIR